MANEYVTSATLKLALGITDTARDELLDQARAAASRNIDRATGRRFYLDGSATARTFTPRGRIVATPDGSLLLVDDIGSTTGLVVEVGAGTSYTTVTSSDYETQPDNALTRGEPITGLLRGIGAYWALARNSRIRITAKWGWPAVPDEVAQAALIQATRYYRRKDSPEGVTGSADWGGIRLSRVDPDVKDLISHLILPTFG
jgi:hypothetical protein